MSYKEWLKQIAVTSVACCVATVTVYVGRDWWDKRKDSSPPNQNPPAPTPIGPYSPEPKKLPQGGSLENSPCSDQTAAFLNCAFHNASDLLKCTQLAVNLRDCRKLYKIEPEGGSWTPWG